MNKNELLYNAWLTELNTRLGRYIVRLMDEAALQPGQESSYTEPLVEVELRLAEDLAELSQAIADKAAMGTGTEPSEARALVSGDPALEAALAYARWDLPIVPGAAWGDGRLVDPSTGRPVARAALQPATAATTDSAQVREWWFPEARYAQSVLCVTGPQLGAASVPVTLMDKLVKHQWFQARPTPVVRLHDLPIAFALYRPPAPPSLTTDNIRVVDEATTIPLPPTAAGTETVEWWVSPENTGGALLTGQELADLVEAVEGRKLLQPVPEGAERAEG